MEYEEQEPTRASTKSIVAFMAIFWIVGGALGGYAIHEHHVAQTLRTQAQQSDAALTATRGQVDDLSSKVSALATQMQQQKAAAAANVPARHASVSTASHRKEASRWNKMQSQLDAQNKAIEDTRNQLTSTQGDLDSTRTELTGSIARTHDELVLLQKRGERNYYEFDVAKSKQFEHDGPFGLRLKKANTKHQYADLELMVDDRALTQKHVNLYQPVMFYTPDSPQAVEIVINRITKDHIHGYVSAPKYRQSELAAASAASTSAGPTGTPNSSPTPVRQKLPAPQ